MARTHRIALALQGGGAHGAFTWGVLDRLLDEVAKGTVELSAIGGAAIGALNATALVYGLHEGAALPGPVTARARRMAEAAQARLRAAWEAMARAAFWGGDPLAAAIGLVSGWNIDGSGAARWADMSSGLTPPADVGISRYLPQVLREVMPELPAILAVPATGVPTLVVSATDVRECRRQLFVDGAVSPAALRASACLPGDGEPAALAGGSYWDGGLMGNPPLTPLVDHLRAAQGDDLVLVTVKPLRRDGVPRTPREVGNRLIEITHNASLVHEVNTIETINRLIEKGMMAQSEADRHPYRRINLHRIQDDQALAGLGVYSKGAAAWDFLSHLCDLGRAAFDRDWPVIVPRLGKESSWETRALCDAVLQRGAIGGDMPGA